MKAGFFVQLLLALMFGLAAGLPQYAGNALKPRAYVTTTEVVTFTVPAVIVHVHGTRTWTETNSLIASTTSINSPPISVSETSYQSVPIPVSEPPSTPLPTSSSSDDIVVSQSITYSSGEFTSEVQAPAPSLTSLPLSSRDYSEAPNPVATAPASSQNGNGYGISYNPYNEDSSCKDADAIANDIHLLAGYGTVRLYGTDCGQLDTVMPVVANYPGMRLILGIWHAEARDSALSETQSIIDAVDKHFDGDWSHIHSVTVGNEIVHHGGNVATLLDSLKAVKGLLASHNVPVATVETPDVFQGNGLALCQASDFVAINAHPFFDNSGDWTDPSLAGDFVKLMGDLVKPCGKQRTVIMESGWPHGSTIPADYFQRNGLPVPSVDNHRIAIKALKDAYVDHAQDLVVFSAYDDLWKQDSDATRGVEHFWGIISN